ncbi:hypothetical protein [Oceanobacillus profundus]|uniref:hypothetical protein n=1 Tax=Oceanobacillus profundus TaxID=372463 RepID=UPI002559831B|nr:hypothetical protein [Oceanobacillus profundus]
MVFNKYKKKPVVIEAIQWTGTNIKDISKFTDSSTDQPFKRLGNELFIITLEGEMRADINDYIIKGVKGEFYPCKPDVFKQTYVAID